MEAGRPKEDVAVPSEDADAEPNRSPAEDVAGDARAAHPKPMEEAENTKTENTTRDEKPGVKAKIAPPASGATIPTSPTAKVPANSRAAGDSATTAGAGAPNVNSNEAVMKLVKSGKLSSQEAQGVKGLAKDHAALKIKVDRLKGLLGRSAKAQREAKGVFVICCLLPFTFRTT